MSKPETPRISFDQRVVIPDTVLLQELEGEYVALNLESELYLGLNQSGSEILNAVSEAETIQEAYQALLEEFEVSPEELRAALSGFLEELLERGLIELTPP